MADMEVEVSGRKRPRCNCATPPWRAEAELRKTAVLLEQMGDVAESLKKRGIALGGTLQEQTHNSQTQRYSFSISGSAPARPHSETSVPQPFFLF